MKSFASVLKESRLRAGLTQKELANQIGLDHSYISKIERSAADPPSRDKVLAMADSLGLETKVQRTYFFLAAGCVGYKDLDTESMNASKEPRPAINLPFTEGALNFPDTTQIEEGELLERIRQLLNNQEISLQERKEYLDTLRSFINWLEYRIREEME